MTSPYSQKPIPFFKGYANRIVVQQNDFVGLNVGYECHQWLYESFSEYLFEWLVEFALPVSEWEHLNQANCRSIIRKAAEVVYSTDQYQKRGEFGELMLHAILRELFDTEPVTNKLFLKSAVNDTVKGFDAVHARPDDNEDLELWLGEVKFYKNIRQAVDAVANEIAEHLHPNKLHEEFLCVGNCVDKSWKFADKVLRLFDRKTSLDDVFKVVCVPVLLTYESLVVQSAKEISESFLQQLRVELNSHHVLFRQTLPVLPVKVVLILLPLEEKEKLLITLDKKLKGLQA